MVDLAESGQQLNSMILKIFSKLNNLIILFEAQQLQEVCKLLTQNIDNLAPFHFSAKSMTNLKDLYEMT